MTRMLSLSAAILACAACAHHPAAEPSPAGAPPASTRSATPVTPAGGAAQKGDTATDVEKQLVGDWRWSGDINTQPANGTWSLNRGAARWTGMIIMGSYPAAPLTSMSVSAGDFRFEAEILNQVYRFNCHLETPQTATCIVNSLNANGQVTATKS